MGFLLVAIVVFLISIIIMIQSAEVRSKLAGYNAQDAIYDEQIAAEEERSQEIDELGKYIQTKGYAEEQAREKLGLTNEGEIVFRKDNNN